MRVKEVYPRVSFHFLKHDFSLRNRTELKRFITGVFKKEHKLFYSLDYIFCSDSYLLKINKDHLGHNFYTDIVTFELSEPKAPPAGEIYISIDRVKDNALKFNQSFARELHRVIFHGVLHLCGYKDKSTRDIALMRHNEEKYLSLYFHKVPREKIKQI